MIGSVLAGEYDGASRPYGKRQVKVGKGKHHAVREYHALFSPLFSVQG